MSLPMAEKRFQELLRRNEKYAEKPVKFRKLKEMVATAPPDFGGLYIITCADQRVYLPDVLGLKPGDANIIRVAGARIDEGVLRSLEIMGSVLPIGYIAIIKHTDCGGSNFTDDDIRQVLAKRAPEHAASIENKVFGTFKKTSIEASIAEDFAKLKAWPFFPETAKIGSYVYDLDSGVVSEVVPENFEAGNL